jgi:gamma-glutamyl:cysteine ligase YbdK (ATP-grasp superfamily)
MPETGRALRDTSDQLVRDLEALSTLEEEKRQLSPDDDRFVDLAARIESIALRVLVASGRQRELTEQIHRAADEGMPSAPTESIEDTARPISAILSDWREAERRLESAEPDSAEQREVEVLVEQLREEYRQAHEAARRENPP